MEVIMMTENNNPDESGFSLEDKTSDFVMLALAGAVAGGFAALAVLPNWLPGMTGSLLGPDTQIYWFLSRASAIVAYALLWLSMALGLMMTGKMARVWPGMAVSADLHQHVSLLGLAFAFSHAFLLLGDSYIHFNLIRLVFPFASGNYMPFWVGIGQIGFYLWAVVALSYYVRRQIGRRGWRLLHSASFTAFLAALAHGIASGTDSSALWMQSLYWLSGASLLFLGFFRLLTLLVGALTPVRPQVRS
jgi:predicted ferric reductase